MNIGEVASKEVIITTLSRRGDGSNSPIRVITEVWDKDGSKIAENDPATDYMVNRSDLQDALMDSGFIKTGSEFNEWFNKYFINKQQ